MAGLAVGFITLRFPVAWRSGFGLDSGFKELITADSYFSFVTFFMLAFGVTFELPLVMTFASVVGLVSSRMLQKNRSYILVGLWILSALITPGADRYSRFYYRQHLSVGVHLASVAISERYHFAVFRRVDYLLHF
jgi:sec-independent protein translocase protein TatC